MTELLYYQNSHLYDFFATVTGIYERNGKYAVILNQTAFFPEGGGQKADTGFIENNSVFDVQAQDGLVLHYCDSVEGIQKGQKVHCSINRDIRFARMQAHSGEHIVSGIAHNLYGAENVGFHMDELLMTVDFDIPLTKQQLSVIEIKANEAVWSNVPVKAYFPDEEKLKSLNYRSKLDNLKNPRIVEIEGIDLCACCAPHVDFTGEIGVIKLLSAISHRGGVRITLHCGKAATEDYIRKNAVLQQCAEQLKVKPTQAAEALIALSDKYNDVKYQMNMQKEDFCKMLMEHLPASEQNITYFINGFSVNDLALLCKYGVNKTPGIFAALSGNDESGYAYAMVCNQTVLKPYAKKINEALNGRGGGRDYLLQGTFTATKQRISDYINHFEVTNT